MQLFAMFNKHIMERQITLLVMRYQLLILKVGYCSNTSLRFILNFKCKFTHMHLKYHVSCVKGTPKMLVSPLHMKQNLYKYLFLWMRILYLKLTSTIIQCIKQRQLGVVEVLFISIKCCVLLQYKVQWQRV